MLRRLRGRPARQDASASGSLQGTTATAVAGSSSPSKKQPPEATGETEPKQLTMEGKRSMLPDKPMELIPSLSMPFSRQELQRIKKRFATMLPADSLSQVPYSVCAAGMPEIAGLPFALLALRYAATLNQSPRAKHSIKSPRTKPGTIRQITFDQLLAVLCILSPTQSVTSKRQLLFLLYDSDRDGVVSVDDFVRTLSASTAAVSQTDLRAAITALFTPPGNTTQQPKPLDFAAFQQLFTDAEVLAALTAPM